MRKKTGHVKYISKIQFLKNKGSKIFHGTLCVIFFACFNFDLTFHHHWFYLLFIYYWEPLLNILILMHCICNILFHCIITILWYRSYKTKVTGNNLINTHIHIILTKVLIPIHLGYLMLTSLTVTKYCAPVSAVCNVFNSSHTTQIYTHLNTKIRTLFGTINWV